MSQTKNQIDDISSVVVAGKEIFYDTKSANLSPELRDIENAIYEINSTDAFNSVNVRRARVTLITSLILISFFIFISIYAYLKYCHPLLLEGRYVAYGLSITPFLIYIPLSILFNALVDALKWNLGSNKSNQMIKKSKLAELEAKKQLLLNQYK